MRKTAISCLLTVVALILTMLGGCDPAADPDWEICEGEPLGEPRPLVVATAWAPSAAANDPFAEHRPTDVICPISAWGEEFGVFEVSTSGCNYLSVEQPLAEPIAAGDTLRVQVWWQSLIANQPAMGHLALAIDGELVWEANVAIPGASEARSITFTSPITAAPGALVTFHLHNHGANSWTLAEFAKTDDAICE